ncbi:MAG: hypothetical protein JKY76_03115 [Proteobacteria bacterium]|nr:hypothetical protein [Pseudomonadota bacterium]
MKTLILLLLISFQVSAEEIDRSAMNTCSYAGGIARETQNIRQVEDDNWIVFEYKVSLMYKEGDGLSNLLVIAKTVYDYALINSSSTDVFNNVFDTCMGKHITQTVSLPEFEL